MEGYEVYQLYLDENKEEILQGKEVLLLVRDLADLTSKVVRAMVVPPEKNLERYKNLWIRTLEREDLMPEPWGIEVLEELDDDAPEVQRIRKKEVSIRDEGRMGVIRRKD